jgi:hypothetical protein
MMPITPRRRCPSVGGRSPTRPRAVDERRPSRPGERTPKMTAPPDTLSSTATAQGARTSASSTATSRRSKDVSIDITTIGHRLHRPVGLRQVDLPALPQPDERHDPVGARRGRSSTARTSPRSSDGRRPAARPRRHGVPEAQPVPQVDLRERRLRPAHPRPRQARKAELDEIVEKSLKRAALWDEVKDRLQESGTEPVGRPAAAAVHRPRDRGRARGDPDGRALLGARPDRDRQDRGADPRAARPLHDRHRHPQHAAGGARLAAHRLLPPRRAVEFGKTSEIFTNPREQRTQDYITGRYGSEIKNAAPADIRSRLRRGHRPAARAHQPDGRLAEHAIGGDALPRPARPRGRREGRRRRQEARRSRSRPSARGPADRASRADGGRPCAMSSRRSRFRRGRADRRLCQEHRQARPLLENDGKIEPLSLLPEMARIATEMVHDVLDAFVERDAEAAARVCERDGGRRFLRFASSAPCSPHDGKSAQHRPVGPPAVRRQESRAGRRPCHQHRRDGLLSRRPASTWPTASRATNREWAMMANKRLLLVEDDRRWPSSSSSISSARAST